MLTRLAFGRACLSTPLLARCRTLHAQRERRPPWIRGGFNIHLKMSTSSRVPHSIAKRAIARNRVIPGGCRLARQVSSATFAALSGQPPATHRARGLVQQSLRDCEFI